ncbi:hypothetical protein EK21DRAFT_83427 [Setomelanomma holmii]|uniref:Uncharacterized protein n=1 Tax=Setomelanomma holmii TaxID=210430 RepID=A0A9P4HNI7_9PLEO|nr:hypothetical protein EK21DRAFT_83427 [Setomelanomma holmii]
MSATSSLHVEDQVEDISVPPGMEKDWSQQENLWIQLHYDLNFALTNLEATTLVMLSNEASHTRFVAYFSCTEGSENESDTPQRSLVEFTEQRELPAPVPQDPSNVDIGNDHAFPGCIPELWEFLSNEVSKRYPELQETSQAGPQEQNKDASDFNTHVVGELTQQEHPTNDAEVNVYGSQRNETPDSAFIETPVPESTEGHSVVTSEAASVKDVPVLEIAPNVRPPQILETVGKYSEDSNGVATSESAGGTSAPGNVVTVHNTNALKSAVEQALLPDSTILTPSAGKTSAIVAALPLGSSSEDTNGFERTSVENADVSGNAAMNDHIKKPQADKLEAPLPATDHEPPTQNVDEPRSEAELKITTPEKVKHRRSCTAIFSNVKFETTAAGTRAVTADTSKGVRVHANRGLIVVLKLAGKQEFLTRLPVAPKEVAPKDAAASTTTTLQKVGQAEPTQLAAPSAPVHPAQTNQPKQKRKRTQQDTDDVGSGEIFCSWVKKNREPCDRSHKHLPPGQQVYYCHHHIKHAPPGYPGGPNTNRGWLLSRTAKNTGK